MHVVYEIAIVEMVEGVSRNVLSEVELLDYSDGLDLWETDLTLSKHRLGAGSGIWFVRHADRAIELCDDSGGSVEATLTHAKRPLKRDDTADVFLRTPAKKGSNQALKFSVTGVSTR